MASNYLLELRPTVRCPRARRQLGRRIEHTCGNTLARLIANLQQHFDARAELPVAA